MSTVTLDTGSLIALERRHQRMWKVLHRARALGVLARMGTIDAIRATWSETAGHLGRLFGLALRLIGIGLVGCAACGVGLFAATALSSIASAIVYTRLSGRTATP